MERLVASHMPHTVSDMFDLASVSAQIEMSVVSSIAFRACVNGELSLHTKLCTESIAEETADLI